MDTKIRIIVVDDFNILVEDICDVINQQSDMKVVATANSGKEIVEIASNIEFDIILMDIEMENPMAGINATRLIRDGNKDAKIIFLTAYETKDMVLTAMATGAVDYIIKGSPKDELLEHIRGAFEDNPVMEGKVQEFIMQEYIRLRQSEKSLLYFINNISQLTSAERELVRLLLKNMKVKEIAKERAVEVVTIKTQINGLLRKFGCSRTKEIIKIIRELNISHLF